MTTALEPTLLKNYCPPDFFIDTVHLHFDIYDDHTFVKSELIIKRNSQSKKTTAPLILDGEELNLKAIFLDGNELLKNKYEVTESHLKIFDLPSHFTLETHVIIYPKKNKKLMGLYQSRHNLCTQCEAEGFRRITYFLDRPDVMSFFSTTITADKKQYPILLSNGNLIEETMLDNQRHFVHWQDPSRKPCYLFALVAGDFDIITDFFETMSNRTIDLYLYLEKGFLDQGHYAITALKKAMKWDEDKFGREYDLDRYMIVAVSDFNMGAMENKGLNIFNTKYILAKPETATDTNYINIERVIGHEYFHNWSGNRITCRDWFQLTLKEGLTVFRDQLFTEDMTSLGVARIDVVNSLRNQQFPEDASPMAHPIRPDSYIKIDNFYTMTIYEKGAEVIRMVRTLLTPEIFRKGMDLYFSRYDGQAVTTEDFIKAMEDASGKDLSQFSRWYVQAGTPVLRVKTVYDAEKKRYDIIVKQSCPPTPNQLEKLPFHLPLSVGLIGAACEDLELHLESSAKVSEAGAAVHTKDHMQTHPKTVILEIKKPEETFSFINVNENPIPSLLRHFSAPVELQYDYTNEQLAQLLQCDSDAFCRFEALQRLSVNIIEKISQDLSHAKSPVLDPLIISSFHYLLSHVMEDTNLLTRLLILPSLKYLMTQLPEFDLDIIYSAKLFLETQLAIELKNEWQMMHEKHFLTGDYSFDMRSMGHRSIKNLCLYYLLKTSDPHFVETAYTQAIHANNMTDQLGALAVLNDHAIPERQKALSHFYTVYKNEPLVVNKWLSLQANSLLPGVISDVKKLIHHEAFDIQNPNNVYALLVTFGENTIRFHDKTGEGYKLLADQTLVIDEINPQVSARIIRPLTQWQQMDELRGELMKNELARLATVKNLSGNLYEIVSKSCE